MSGARLPALAVCVYCAASTRDPEMLALAEAVGTALGRRGWSLVSGGGNVSMMGAVARGARAAGARTTGIIPGRLMDREVGDVDSDELLVVGSMRERKREMEARSDAFLVLPGGIGTLEEFFEMWTSRVLGFHSKPVVILDPGGHYRPLLDWLETLRESSFVSDASFDHLEVHTDVEAALDACIGDGRR